MSARAAHLREPVSQAMAQGRELGDRAVDVRSNSRSSEPGGDRAIVRRPRRPPRETTPTEPEAVMNEASRQRLDPARWRARAFDGMARQTWRHGHTPE